MKKLLIAFAFLFGTMFASCNGSSTSNTEALVEVVTDSVSVDSLVVDSIITDTLTVDTIA